MQDQSHWQSHPRTNVRFFGALSPQMDRLSRERRRRERRKIENLDAFSSRIPPKNRPIAYNSEIYKEMLEIQWKSYKSQIYKEIGLLQNISFQIYKEIGLRQNITFQIYKEIGNLQNRRFAYNFSNL